MIISAENRTSITHTHRHTQSEIPKGTQSWYNSAPTETMGDLLLASVGQLGIRLWKIPDNHTYKKAGKEAGCYRGTSLLSL